MQPDIEDPGPPPELVALDRVLDRLFSLLHDTEADRLDTAARGYVEDAIEAAMAAMLLSALGADVRAASSTREAVEGAWIFHPHVLVCEVPAVADRARALVCDLRREDLGMPAVAVVASADAAFHEAARGAGFADVLAGPVTFSDLAAAIRQAVGGQQG